PTSALISFFFSDFINRNWSVVCYAPCLLLPEIQVNDRLLTFFDNNEDASVSVSLRPSYDGVSSNGQRHNLGNFIGGGTLVLDVFKGLSVDRVDGIRAVWKVQRVTIVEFVGGGIDLEISLWQLSSISKFPGLIGPGDNGSSLPPACATVEPSRHKASRTIRSA